MADWAEKSLLPLGPSPQAESHRAFCLCNLAPEGSAGKKLPVKEGTHFKASGAGVLVRKKKAQARILDGTVVAGDVLVIRYEGPRGGPGMREMLSPTSAIYGRGLGSDVALITDGSFLRL